MIKKLLPGILLFLICSNCFAQHSDESSNVKRLQAYEDTLIKLGKTFVNDTDEMNRINANYTFIKVGTGTGGGMMSHPVPGAPSAWLAYVMVDDVRASTAKAKSLGATVMKDVTDVREMLFTPVL